MDMKLLCERLEEFGVTVKLENGKLLVNPRCAAGEALRIIQNSKPEIVDYLLGLSPDSGLALFLNPPDCHNPFTPHSSHKHPWECDPNSCYCYKQFGFPEMCRGVPCRWVWPNGLPDEIEEKGGDNK